MITKYFVYRIKAGNKRYTHTGVAYSTEAEAKAEAEKYSPSYIEGCDDTGKESTGKIVVNA